MKKAFMYIMAGFLVVLAVPLLAADKEVIAIYDLRAEGVPASTASMVTDWIYAAMSNGPYQIVDRSRIRTLLQEQEVQMTGMTDPQGAVQAGKILSANCVFAGSVCKIGTKYVITGRMINAESGVARFGHSEYTWQESDLDMCAQRFVDNILCRMSGSYSAAPATVVPPLRAQYSRPNADTEKKLIMKTLTTLYDAYINKDVEAYLSVLDLQARLFCADYDIRGHAQIRNLRVNTTFRYLGGFSYNLSNVVINIASDGRSATITDTYTLSYTILSTGQRNTESAVERFRLVKKGNSWYITENSEG